MNSLKSQELAYWEGYLLTIAEELRPQDPFVSDGYAGTPEITDGLLELYLSGKKTAGSSILEDFLSAGDPPPRVGNYWIYLNSRHQPSCILRTERIEIHPFKDIPAEIATAEGEGDLSLDYWKKVHSELYSPFLQSWGVKHIDDATVVTEFFKIVHR